MIDPMREFAFEVIKEILGHSIKRFYLFMRRSAILFSLAPYHSKEAVLIRLR